MSSCGRQEEFPVLPFATMASSPADFNVRDGIGVGATGISRKKNAASQFRPLRKMDPQNAQHQSEAPQPMPHASNKAAPPPLPQCRGEERKDDKHLNNSSISVLMSPTPMVTSSKTKLTKAKRSKANNNKPTSPKISPFIHKKAWNFVATTLFLPFLLCESFLTLLVLRYNNFGDVVISVSDLPHARATGAGSYTSQEIISAEKDRIDELNDTNTAAGVDAHSVSINGIDDNKSRVGESLDDLQDVSANIRKVTNASNASSALSKDSKYVTGLSQKGIGIDFDQELLILQSKLADGFRMLEGTLLDCGAEREEDMNKDKAGTYAESLCETILVRAEEVVSMELSEIHEKENDSRNIREKQIQNVGSVSNDVPTSADMSSVKTPKTVPVNHWKSLAFDAQRCVGGAKLSTLSKDVDEARLRKARDVFERLVRTYHSVLHVFKGLIKLNGWVLMSHILNVPSIAPCFYVCSQT